jgi:hypothetical protein
MRRIVQATVLLILIASTAEAWNKPGHMVTGAIANGFDTHRF